MIHYTTIEQSKRLLELGLNPKSADMTYPWYIEEDGDRFEDGHQITIPEVGKSTLKGYIPCWSVAALLEIMPYVGRYNPTIGKFDNAYHCDYFDENGESMKHFMSNNSMIEACCEMVIWLLENNYIKKEELL